MAQEISEGTSVENMVENIPELRAYRGNELNEKYVAVCCVLNDFSDMPINIDQCNQ